MNKKSYTYKRARDLTVGDELIMENHGFVTEREEDSSLIKQVIVGVEVEKTLVKVLVEKQTEWYVMNAHTPVAVSGLIVDKWWNDLFTNERLHNG